MSGDQGRAVRGRLAVVASLVVVVLGIVVVMLAARGAADRPPAPPRSAITEAAGPRSSGITGSPDVTGSPTGTRPSDVTASPDVTRSSPARPSPSSSTDAAENSTAGRGLASSVPTDLTIPTIGVRSRLIGLGLDANEEMEVPKGAEYDRAGWYTESPTPGEIGPTVIAGHVDGEDGPSVFHQLGALETGDPVTVTRTDGKKVTYVVYRAERYAKNEFPTDRVYGNTTGPELRLITCSGGIGPDGHYLDNTVVYARLAPT